MDTKMKTEAEVEYIFLQGHSPRETEPPMIMLVRPKIILNLPVLKGMLPIVTQKIPENVEYIRLDEIKKIVFKAGDKETMALVAEVLDWAQPSGD